MPRVLRVLALCLAALPLAGAREPVAHERLALGYRLAAWARGAGDAEAMLAAARVVAGLTIRPAIRTGSAGAPLAIGDAQSAATELAREAVTMAPDDAAVARGAATVIASTGRGFSAGPGGPGPVRLVERIGPGVVLRWTAAARGGETAIVSVVGDGDSNIDLAVANPRGAPVCADRSRDATPMCRWYAARNARYLITISNAGRIAADVVVLSN